MQTVEFQNVMVTGVSYGALKAGEAQGINMTLTMTFTDMPIG